MAEKIKSRLVSREAVDELLRTKAELLEEDPTPEAAKAALAGNVIVIDPRVYPKLRDALLKNTGETQDLIWGPAIDFVPEVESLDNRSEG